MSNKRPQPTAVLVKRLRRVSKYFDAFYEETKCPKHRAHANTCLQAAARLELLSDPLTLTCEGCSEKATTEDDGGVPLCDGCYENLDR